MLTESGPALRLHTACIQSNEAICALTQQPSVNLPFLCQPRTLCGRPLPAPPPNMVAFMCLCLSCGHLACGLGAARQVTGVGKRQRWRRFLQQEHTPTNKRRSDESRITERKMPAMSTLSTAFTKLGFAWSAAPSLDCTVERAAAVARDQRESSRSSTVI